MKNESNIIGSQVRVYHKKDFRHEKVRGVICSENLGKDKILFRVIYFEDVSKSKDGSVDYYSYSYEDMEFL